MAAKNEDEIRSPLKAIRANCLQCVGSSNEVRLCTAKSCHLFPFRFGRNPYIRKREMSEEQREKAVKRLRAARETRRINDHHCDCPRSGVQEVKDDDA